MGKNCKEILAYTDDVMDDRASDQVRDMFFQHLDQCPTCKSKYEISLHIRQLLRDDTVVLGDDFTQAVMGRLRSVRARQKPERKSGSGKSRFSALPHVWLFLQRSVLDFFRFVKIPY